MAIYIDFVTAPYAAPGTKMVMLIFTAAYLCNDLNPYHLS
jgi:hypothetical protein